MVTINWDCVCALSYRSLTMKGLLYGQNVQKEKFKPSINQTESLRESEFFLKVSEFENCPFKAGCFLNKGEEIFQCIKLIVKYSMTVAVQCLLPVAVLFSHFNCCQNFHDTLML